MKFPAQPIGAIGHYRRVVSAACLYRQIPDLSARKHRIFRTRTRTQPRSGGARTRCHGIEYEYEYRFTEYEHDYKRRDVGKDKVPQPTLPCAMHGWNASKFSDHCEPGLSLAQRRPVQHGFLQPFHRLSFRQASSSGNTRPLE